MADEATAEPLTEEAPAPEPPKTELLAEYLGRHRFWDIALHFELADGGVDPATVTALRRFVKSNLLTLSHYDAERGIAVVRASKSTLERAFSAKDANGRVIGEGLRMVVVAVDGVRYRSVVGEISLPPDLAPGVIKVSGFDTRPAPKAPEPAAPLPGE